VSKEADINQKQPTKETYKRDVHTSKKACKRDLYLIEMYLSALSTKQKNTHVYIYIYIYIYIHIYVYTQVDVLT